MNALSAKSAYARRRHTVIFWNKEICRLLHAIWCWFRLFVMHRLIYCRRCQQIVLGSCWLISGSHYRNSGSSSSSIHSTMHTYSSLCVSVVYECGSRNTHSMQCRMHIWHAVFITFADDVCMMRCISHLCVRCWYFCCHAALAWLFSKYSTAWWKYTCINGDAETKAKWKSFFFCFLCGFHPNDSTHAPCTSHITTDSKDRVHSQDRRNN